MSYLRNFLIQSLLILPLYSLSLSAQDKEVRKIEHKSEETVYSQDFGKDVIRLLRNVIMSHEEIVLTCDSAHLNQKKRVFHGYGNIHLIKADTLELWGDEIFYDGVADIAQVDGRVIMNNNNTTLKTNHLNYNMGEETAWYFGGGQIIDSLNILESQWGYYYPDKEEYYFKENVFLSNEDLTLSTDTLHYNSQSELIKFLGATQIFGDTNYIYCESGWYDSQTNQSSFYQHALFQSGAQVIRGDSLVYDRDNEWFWAFGQVEAKDTIENSIIYGQKLFYDEQIDRISVTEKPLFVLAEEPDSLFLFADTLLSYTIDSINSRKIEAFHHVRFFRNDIQGQCDSLDYLIRDSVITLFTEPILWQNNNQLTALNIKIKMGEQGINYIELIEKGFLITELDSLHYNQIKGKSVLGYFVDNELSRVVVDGNGESIFFPEDENGKIGMNKVLSSEIAIQFKEGKINRVKFINDPDSRLDPLGQVSDADKKLEGFRWFRELRPKSRNDLEKREDNN